MGPRTAGFSLPPISLIILAQTLLVQLAAALVCQIPSATPGGAARNKTCPDFKADPTFIYCCASKLPLSSQKDKHGIFCCSEHDFNKEQQDLADAELRHFVKDYLLVLILCGLVGVGVIIFIVSLVCKRLRSSPAATGTSTTTAPSGSYRPVDTIPPKMYEAPPPYERFVPPPDQGANEWNCILENEVNVGRRPAPFAT